jgi:hypothetical protein
MIDSDSGQECVARSIGSWRFASKQRAHHGLLVERIGRLELSFSLATHDGGILFSQVAAHLRFLGIRFRLPRIFAPMVIASERENTDGRSAIVDVSLRVPVFGVLARYTGAVFRSPA